MLEQYFARPKTVDRIRSSWLAPAIEQYVAWSTERKASQVTVTHGVRTLIRFGGFAHARGAETWTDLPAQVGPFVEHCVPDRGPAGRSEKTRATMRSQTRAPVEQALRLLIPGFIGTTRRRLALPFQETAPGFFHYLQHERGLRPETRRGYIHHLAAFEAHLRDTGVARLVDLTPGVVSEFIARSAKRLGPDGVQGRRGAVRVFLRYLHRQEITTTDLGASVPRGRKYRHASIPRSISSEDVERVLKAVDRRAAIGKRDYAMLLLLVTYGLRAREVAGLQLDDIAWKQQQFHVRARKGGHSTIYPLSTPVGEAIVDYLRSGRPKVADRHVFLTSMTPYTPLRHHVVSDRATHYLRSAGVDVRRPGSHTFRHTCVQRLVDNDFPFKTIGDYVGHRSPSATQVYGKVATHLLRQLALGDGEEAL